MNMINKNEFAKALKLLNHEYFLILYGLKEKLDNLGIGTFSEIGRFVSDQKDNCRLYLTYYFTYPNCSIEYKFVICVNREEPKETLFFLGFSRKDNKILDGTDKQNCEDILTEINKNLHTNYGSSNGNITLSLNLLFEDDLKNFIKEAFNNRVLNLGKLSKVDDDSKEDFITLTKAKNIIKNL